jgi:hypothetical protein
MATARCRGAVATTSRCGRGADGRRCRGAVGDGRRRRGAGARGQTAAARRERQIWGKIISVVYIGGTFSRGWWLQPRLKVEFGQAKRQEDEPLVAVGGSNRD